MKRRTKFARTTLLISVLLGFLTGIWMARNGSSAPSIYAWGLLCVSLALWRRANLYTLFALFLCGGTFGLVRGHSAWHDMSAYKPLYGHEVKIIGKALSDSTYGTNSQIEFDLGSLRMQNEAGEMALKGKLLITGYGEPMVYRGDYIEVSGKLRTIRGGRQGVIGYADISRLSRSSPWYETARLRFSSGLASALPEPLSSFGLGLLIGQKTSIPDDVSKRLSVVGLTHLVAVSGYNLTILIEASRKLFGKRSKYQSTLLSVGLIFLFLLFSGLSASIVRAAIVSMLSLMAWYYGRAFRPTLLILLSAAITAGYFPPYLWTDIGWWLSFLAFYGVIVVAPLITKRLYKKRKPKVLASLIIETSSAQVMTVPIIAFIFGDVSVISLVTNILVVPLVPLAMLLTMIAGLGGMFLPILSGWFALPARLLLTYMLDVVALFARVPHAQIHFPIAGPIMLYIYTCVLAFTGIWWRTTKAKHGKITDITTKI